MTETRPEPKVQQETQTEVSSCKLLGARRKLVIEHNGELYTLRITSKDKLILTK